MVMLKKIVVLISVLIIFIVCGFCFLKNFSKNNVSKSIVRVQFASWGSESEIKILKPLLVDFEKENPSIKVEFMHIPQNYFQKIHLLFASNTAPDVIFINNQYLPIYANSGVLEELSNYFSTKELKEYYPQSIGALSWKGGIYAIPRDISNLVIFYNKDLFRKYDIPYPHSGWTYAEFLEIAKKLTHYPEVFGISFEEEPLFFLPYLTMCGGWNNEDVSEFFESDVLKKENNARGLSLYSDLRNKYHVAPLKTESASATMAQLFLQGRLAMHLSGRWLVPKYRQEAKFDWDIVEFPRYDSNSENIVPLDSSGWAVSKMSKHKAEAVKLVKYLSSQKSGQKFTQSGLIVPARMDVAKSDFFLDGKNPEHAQVFLSVINNSNPTPVSINYKEILDTLKNKTEYIFNK